MPDSLQGDEEPQKGWPTLVDTRPFVRLRRYAWLVLVGALLAIVPATLLVRLAAWVLLGCLLVMVAPSAWVHAKPGEPRIRRLSVWTWIIVPVALMYVLPEALVAQVFGALLYGFILIALVPEWWSGLRTAVDDKWELAAQVSLVPLFIGLLIWGLFRVLFDW